MLFVARRAFRQRLSRLTGVRESWREKRNQCRSLEQTRLLRRDGRWRLCSGKLGVVELVVDEGR